MMQKYGINNLSSLNHGSETNSTECNYSDEFKGKFRNVTQSQLIFTPHLHTSVNASNLHTSKDREDLPCRCNTHDREQALELGLRNIPKLEVCFDHNASNSIVSRTPARLPGIAD
jgi:thioredoxin-related protein